MIQDASWLSQPLCLGRAAGHGARAPSWLLRSVKMLRQLWFTACHAGPRQILQSLGRHHQVLLRDLGSASPNSMDPAQLSRAPEPHPSHCTGGQRQPEGTAMAAPGLKRPSLGSSSPGCRSQIKMPQATVVEIQHRVLSVAELLHDTATILFQLQHGWEGREHKQERAAQAWHRRDLTLRQAEFVLRNCTLIS